jgi:predicted phosphodiesterase
MLAIRPTQKPVLLKPLAFNKSTRVSNRYMLPVAVLLLIVIALLVAQPVTYKTTQGRLTLHATAGKGKVVFNLGPAGAWEFDTHKTPITLSVDYRLENRGSHGQELWQIFQPIYDLQKSKEGKRILVEFVVLKLTLLLLMGVVAGLISNGGKKHLGMLDGLVAAILVVAIMSGLTLATIDKSPRIKATGYASEAPPAKFLDLTKKLGGNFRIPDWYIRDQMRGMEIVAKQRARTGSRDFSEEVFHVLVLADLHDNRRGLEIAKELFINNEQLNLTAILLVGDMVHFGSSAEAKAVFTNWPKAKVPVYFVGGNHEDTGAMTQLEKLGYVRLSNNPTEAKGLLLLCADDPLAYTLAMDSDKQLLKEASDLLAEEWLSSGQPPLVVVHDLAQAEAVVAEAKKGNHQVVVVYGHQHQLSIEQDRNVVLVQGGSAGASGFEAKGRDPDTPYTYQILEYANHTDPHLIGVYSFTYEDGDDSFAILHTPID